MKPIQHPADLKAYYQRTQVVTEYLPRRTTQPLGRVLHQGQVRFLNQVFAERSPGTVLELAPGPARLTAELVPVPLAIGVDFSVPMLLRARERTAAAGRPWHFLRADAFALPIGDARFDLAFSLRFVRHFGRDDRRRLYAELHRILRRGGALVIDAQNRAVRDPGHAGRHAVYDELYTHDQLHAELEQCNFRVIRMQGVIKHHAVQRALNRLRSVGFHRLARGFIELLERVPSRNPSTWMVLGERV